MAARPPHFVAFLLSLPLITFGEETAGTPTGSGVSELTLPVIAAAAAEAPAPILSEENLEPMLVSIPAPRGLIVDRKGRPLAQTRTKQYLAIRLKSLQSEGADLEQSTEIVKTILAETPALQDIDFSEVDFTEHWKHRPYLPFPLETQLSERQAGELASICSESQFLTLETIFERVYPPGSSVAHIVGYVSPSKPFQHGPLSDPEPLWPDSEPKQGLEISRNEDLRGTDGLASYVFTEKGMLREIELIEPAVPGRTVALSIDLEMQELAHRILEENGKPGSLVIVDSLTGDVLAMADYPTFDPNTFVNGISRKAYEDLVNNPDEPLFARSRMGEYPPGSTFKPFVALAALDAGAVTGIMTRFRSSPYLEIDGRRFNNWNDRDEGMIDVRFALLRSSNTWMYQAGMRTGGPYILKAAKAFGFAQPLMIDLPTAQGNLPEEKNVLANQAVANLSIGQGAVATSPLQLALAMGGLAAGTFVPEPRLVLQVQEAKTNEVVSFESTSRRSKINTRKTDREAVRAGMWGVVNHKDGTGKTAHHDLPEVYGKTGTAQWKPNRNLAWFAGYVGSDSPRIAFAAMVQGGPGESVSGGKNAGPLIGKFVEAIYDDPDKYGVEITVESGAEPFSAPLQTPITTIPTTTATPVTQVGTTPVSAPSPVPVTPLSEEAPAALPPRQAQPGVRVLREAGGPSIRVARPISNR